MADIISVTEGRVSVTANDTEANIRAGAGFADASEPETAPVDDAKPEPKADTAERNEDGTFKAKAEPKADEPAKVDGNPRTSHQAKINQAIRAQREAERRAEDAERRATEHAAELQALRQPKAPIAQPAPAPTSAQPTYLQLVQRYQAAPDAPKLDDFVTAGLDDPYGAHQAAMAAFIADQRLAEREAARAEATQRDAHQSNFEKALSLAAEAHPDFEALLRADAQQVYPVAVTDQFKVEAAEDPSLSAELFHHLLTHPDDAARLATMTTPIAAAREIGRLTARLSSAPAGPETVLPPTTTAKPLIKPVRPSVMAHESSPPDDLPFGPQYIARMNEQDRKAREARRA